jgi:hypothetical protein
MNDLELKDAIRTAARVAPTTADLSVVRTRARSLRRRRAVGAVALVAFGALAIAWPLQQLGQFGDGTVPSTPTSSPLAFTPLDGWYTATTSTNGNTSEVPASSALIANIPLPQNPGAYPLGVDNGILDRLPSTGIVIVAQQLLQTRNPIPVDAGYHPATLPLNLDDGASATGPWEGIVRTDLTWIRRNVLVEGRPVMLSVWLGTDHPDRQLRREAQRALDQLTVVPMDPPTNSIDQFGISMPVPQGWHALLYGGDPTLIVSTNRIDFLSWDDTRTTLQPNDVTMVLDESDALVELQGWAPLQGPLSIGDGERCDGCEALDDGAPPTPGHVLYQRTFTTGGRAFSLYVEFGSPPSPAQLDAVNAVLAGVAIQPIANPTYTPAPGTTRVGPIDEGDDVPEVRASDADRTLRWGHASMRLPDGWTGQTYPVSGLERPLSLLAAGSWNFTLGGYCGPVNALSELPSDGALVWVDGYIDGPTPGLQVFADKPTSIDLTSAPTDPSPCFAGTDPYVFRWIVGGNAYVVHVALGPDASPATVAAATDAVMSLG